MCEENSGSRMLAAEKLHIEMIEEMGEGDERRGRARDLRGLSRKELWSSLWWVEDRRRLRGGEPHTPCPKRCCLQGRGRSPSWPGEASEARFKLSRLSYDFVCRPPRRLISNTHSLTASHDFSVCTKRTSNQTE